MSSDAFVWLREDLVLEDVRKRLLQASVLYPATGCRLWVKALDKRGYGAIRLNGRTEKAHRVSFEAFKGPIPKGHLVRHSCDTPACILPEHLLSGTDKDNGEDMLARGRAWHQQNPGKAHRRGEEVNTAKLTPRKVKKIREDAAKKVPRTVLAQRYGITVRSISHIVNRKSWRHVL